MIERSPDRLIAAYFEQPQPELPDRTFDAVRQDIHRTRQRLVLGPWSEPEPRMFAGLLAAAAVIVAMIGVALVKPFGPEAGSGTLVRSPLYGYSIAVPPGWSATPAAVRWDGESQPSLGPNVDLYSGPHLIVLGFAGPFAGDLTAFQADRVAANARDHAECGSDAYQGGQPIDVAGQPGLLLTWDCGALVEQAITVHAGVGYSFTIRDLNFAASLDPTDLASVRSMLDSVTFPSTPVTSP